MHGERGRIRKESSLNPLFFNYEITVIDAARISQWFIRLIFLVVGFISLTSACERIHQLFSHDIAMLTLPAGNDLDQHDYFQNPLYVCIHNCPECVVTDALRNALSYAYSYDTRALLQVRRYLQVRDYALQEWPWSSYSNVWSSHYYVYACVPEIHKVTSNNKVIGPK